MALRPLIRTAAHTCDVSSSLASSVLPTTFRVFKIRSQPKQLFFFQQISDQNPKLSFSVPYQRHLWNVGHVSPPPCTAPVNNMRSIQQKRGLGMECTLGAKIDYKHQKNNNNNGRKNPLVISDPSTLFISFPQQTTKMCCTSFHFNRETENGKPHHHHPRHSTTRLSSSATPVTTETSEPVVPVTRSTEPTDESETPVTVDSSTPAVMESTESVTAVTKESKGSNEFMTLPTILTLARIAAVPMLIAVFYSSPQTATAIFILAALTDWLDGYLARKMGNMTEFGAFLDPVADKLMVATALVLLCTEKVPLDLPLWALPVPAIAIIGREIAMSAVREWAATQGEELHKAVAVSSLGKWKTATQLASITLLLALRHTGFEGISNQILAISGISLLYASAGLAVLSLGQYLRSISGALKEIPRH